MKSENCHLCKSGNQILKHGQLIGRDYFQCLDCHLVYVSSVYFPKQDVEQNRYNQHQNNESDIGYVRFLEQILTKTGPYLNSEMPGLDYGCGPNPVLANLLQKSGYKCELYDPFYFPDFPKKQFDFIFSTECFEHFFYPFDDIEKVVSLLNPGGFLAIMTDTWCEDVDFQHWYYIRDLTHVSFFHQKTMMYLTTQFPLQLIESDGKRCFVFKKTG